MFILFWLFTLVKHGLEWWLTQDLKACQNDEKQMLVVSLIMMVIEFAGISYMVIPINSINNNIHHLHFFLNLQVKTIIVLITSLTKTYMAHACAYVTSNLIGPY